MLHKGVMDKCQQKIKEKPTGCVSSVSLKSTGMKSMRKDAKDTRPARTQVDARAAGES